MSLYFDCTILYILINSFYKEKFTGKVLYCINKTTMKPEKHQIPDIKLPAPKERIVQCARQVIIASETNNDTLFNNNVLWISMAIDELNQHKKELPF